MQEASGDAQGVSTGEGDVPSRNRIGLENALSPSFGSETAVPTTASGKAKESADSLGGPGTIYGCRVSELPSCSARSRTSL